MGQARIESNLFIYLFIAVIPTGILLRMQKPVKKAAHLLAATNKNLNQANTAAKLRLALVSHRAQELPKRAMLTRISWPLQL